MGDRFAEVCPRMSSVAPAFTLAYHALVPQTMLIVRGLSRRCPVLSRRGASEGCIIGGRRAFILACVRCAGRQPAHRWLMNLITFVTVGLAPERTCETRASCPHGAVCSISLPDFCFCSRSFPHTLVACRCRMPLTPGDISQPPSFRGFRGQANIAVAASASALLPSPREAVLRQLPAAGLPDRCYEPHDPMAANSHCFPRPCLMSKCLHLCSPIPPRSCHWVHLHAT